jgi:hypothetical protein
VAGRLNIANRLIVVDQASAGPQLPGVTYYAPGYRNVSTAIKEWVETAPPVIEVRWQVEDKETRIRIGAEINETMAPYVRARDVIFGKCS